MGDIFKHLDVVVVAAIGALIAVAIYNRAGQPFAIGQRAPMSQKKIRA